VARSIPAGGLDPNIAGVAPTRIDLLRTPTRISFGRGVRLTVAILVNPRERRLEDIEALHRAAL
jgi:hypothetical protein